MTRTRLLTFLLPISLVVVASCGSGTDDTGDDDDTGETAEQDASTPGSAGDAVRLDVCSGDRPDELTAVGVAFADTYCAKISEVDDLYALLDLPVATATQLEVLRIGVCTPDAPTPDREQSEAAFELFVRTSAEQNPALAERWLAEGVLTADQRTEGEGETPVVELAIDNAAITRLVEAEQGLFEAVAADPAAFCGS